MSFDPTNLCGWIDSADRYAMAEKFAPHLSRAHPTMMGSVPDSIPLYKALHQTLGSYPHYPAQEIGDCTSFGTGHTVDLLQAIEIQLGHPLEWRETCTEAIYGMGREIAGMHYGDGCYGVAVAKACTQFGTVPREAVGAYSGSRARSWGRSGVPADVKAKAAGFKVEQAVLVTTLDEADAALNNGYPFTVCSNQGFRMTRDETGLCEASGYWAHCMMCGGRRVSAGLPEYLIFQSWGDQAPSGPTVDDQPPFSFWIRGVVLSRMLAGQDSLAFSGFEGFVRRRLTFLDAFPV